MRLPDFREHPELNQLRRQIGADLVDYESASNWRAVDIGELLRTSGIEVRLEDVEFRHGLLVYQDRQVLLYIRVQYQFEERAPKEYKFHIGHCTTLERMWREGRKERYVVATRTDGFFIVETVWKPTYRKEQGLREMRVCKNCLSLMLDEFPQNAPTFNYESFDLEAYFGLGLLARFADLPTYTDVTLPPNEYADNWSELSRQIREAAGWRCESCGGDFRRAKQKLHVHHRDGRKHNNARQNLRVLCSSCHRLEPGHSHMGR